MHYLYTRTYIEILFSHIFFSTPLSRLKPQINFLDPLLTRVLKVSGTYQNINGLKTFVIAPMRKSCLA